MCAHTVSILEVCIECEDVFRFFRHDASLLVLSYSLLKEVGFAFQGNVLHEVKRILHIVHLTPEERGHAWLRGEELRGVGSI